MGQMLILISHTRKREHIPTYTSSTLPTFKYEPIRGLCIYVQGKTFSLPSNKIDSVDNGQTKQKKNNHSKDPSPSHLNNLIFI